MLAKFILLYRALAAIIRRPALLNLILEDNVLWKKRVTKKHQMPRGLPQLSIKDIIPVETGITLNHVLLLGGGSMVTDLALLKSLASQTPNCKYFEIGTWRGESAITVSEEAAIVHTLNLSPEELMDMGEKQDYYGQIGVLIQNKANIVQWYGNSLHFDYSLPNLKFDLIFIDGDHHYATVKNDTLHCIQHLAHQDTVFVWHDYSNGPEEIRFEILAGILDGIDPKMKKNLFHVSNTQCAVYHPKVDAGQSFMQPPVNVQHLFELKISLNAITK